jgi:hypothetical protein
VKINILAAQRGSIQMRSSEYNYFKNKVSLNKTAEVVTSNTTPSKDFLDIRYLRVYLSLSVLNEHENFDFETSAFERVSKHISHGDSINSLAHTVSSGK